MENLLPRPVEDAPCRRRFSCSGAFFASNPGTSHDHRSFCSPILSANANPRNSREGGEISSVAQSITSLLILYSLSLSFSLSITTTAGGKWGRLRSTIFLLSLSLSRSFLLSSFLSLQLSSCLAGASLFLFSLLFCDSNLWTQIIVRRLESDTQWCTSRGEVKLSMAEGGLFRRMHSEKPFLIPRDRSEKTPYC